MNNRFIYEAELQADELGGYFVQFPQLPEAFTQGDDLLDAADMAADVLTLVIAEYIDDGKILPDPIVKGHSDAVLRIAISVEITPEIVERSKCVSVTEAATMLKLSKGRISHMLDSGVLQAVPFGNERLVSLASINERLAAPRSAGRPRKTAAVV